MQLICIIKTFTAAIVVRQQYTHNFTLFQTGDDFVVDIHACSEHSISGTNWFYLAVYSCRRHCSSGCITRVSINKSSSLLKDKNTKYA